METLVGFKMSSGIGQLGEALSKAQGSISGASKDSKNPFYNSKYADLASVWDCCRKPLSENGLSVVQIPSFENSTVHVETMLVHSSGEWISGSLSLQPVREVKGGGSEPWMTPQGIGSAISYARRYGLASIVGIYQEDDDANSSSGKTTYATYAAPPKPGAANTTPIPTSKPQPTPAASFQSVGEEVGVIEKLSDQKMGGSKKDKPFRVFTFNGRSVYSWDTKIHPFLVANKDQSIYAVIEQKGTFANLVTARPNDPFAKERAESDTHNEPESIPNSPLFERADEDIPF